MTPGLAALASYSAQVCLVVAAATGAAWLARVRAPEVRLWLWRATWLACLLLPLAATTTTPSPITSVTFEAAEAALASAPSAQDFARLGPAMLLVLGAGTALRLLWMGVGLTRLSRLRRASEPAILEAEEEAMRQALAPRARVHWTDSVRQPVTFGVWRPLVLLPRRLALLEAGSRRAVLCHELIHVARRDWLWIIAEDLTRVALWFHPAVWWMLDELHISREQVVDALVVRRTGARKAYMQTLLWFADTPAEALPATAFLHRRHLRARLRRLAEESPMSRSRLALAILSLVVLVGGASAAAVRAVPLDLGPLGLAQSRPSPRLLGPTLKPTPWAGLFGGLQAGADRERPYTSKDKDVTLPTAVSERKPVYTPQAMEAKIQGEVGLLAVVKADGRVGDVTVAKSLDSQYGLDQAAVDAMKLWTFKPGTRNGKAVPVQVDVEMRFTLK